MGARCDRSCRDIWSYGIDANAWTQEKYVGNPPCRWAKVGCAFNASGDGIRLERAIPFFHEHMSEAFQYSYCGDTFVWSAETRRWSHVITRGFPTYRTLADLVIDQETDRTYLFGGCELC